jgi:hypothetical protein
LIVITQSGILNGADNCYISRADIIISAQQCDFLKQVVIAVQAADEYPAGFVIVEVSRGW